MRTRGLVLPAGFVALLGFGSPAQAQWVRLQRCSGALPCAIPFGVRYNPDPLIAGQYGFVSPNSTSGRITFGPEGPAVHLDRPLAKLKLPDFASEASRKIQLTRPAPAEKKAPPVVEPESRPEPKPGSPGDSPDF